MPKVSQLFDVQYGHSLELNRLHLRDDGGGVAFVSRTTKNNGVVAYVDPLPGLPPAPAGELTCALSGNGVLSTFLQERPFYTAFHVARLVPKQPMTAAELLYFAMCIKANSYKYSYGRQANRSLRDIALPAREDVPAFVQTVDTSMFEGADRPVLKTPPGEFSVSEWKPFLLSDLFTIRKGKRLTKAAMKPGKTPFVSATDSNNGLRQLVSAAPTHPGNLITIAYNGSVAETFYQPAPFFASDDVNVLYPKFEMDAALALFICTVVRLEKYRFNYGRKWNLERMLESEIRLPATAEGSPDWAEMRRYISSLPFSSQLASAGTVAALDD